MKEIQIKRENWEKVARAVGDTNPIHFDDEVARSFGFESAVCPGVYILALAEHHVHKRWLYRKQRRIWGKFRDYLYDGDKLTINRNGNLILKNEFGGLVAMIDERDFSDEPRELVALEIVSKITSDDLTLFYDGMSLKARRRVPYAFAFGAVINGILNTKAESERSEEFKRDIDNCIALSSMEFSLYHLPKLGELRTGIKIYRTESHKRGVVYNVNATCFQGDNKVVCGVANGALIRKKEEAFGIGVA